VAVSLGENWADRSADRKLLQGPSLSKGRQGKAFFCPRDLEKGPCPETQAPHASWARHHV